jgi:hypothetical protein
MKNMFYFKKNKCFFGLLLIFMFIYESNDGLLAAEVTFTAEFRPSSANPEHKKFKNTTAQSGFCLDNPSQCLGEFSVGLPLTPIFNGMDASGAARNSAFFKMPSSFRSVMVESTIGDAYEVRWRVSSFSGRYRLPVSSLELVPEANGVVYAAHDALWDSRRWVYSPIGCGGTNYASFDHIQYRFLWLVPEGDGSCIKYLLREIPGPMSISQFSIGYELIAPDPLAMKNGVYTGDLVLTVGPGGDFDFGDRSMVNDSTISLHFVLTVQHELRADFPPDSHRVTLVPEGGWSSWVDHGRLPTSLSKDLPFSLSSSAPFSVTLECSHPQPNGDCGLLNTSTPTAPLVPVAVAITMPGFREAQRNLDALNLKLSTQGVAPRFISNAYAVNRASRLHFDVTGEHVKSILDHPGDQYRGNVTVVFDAQP